MHKLRLAHAPTSDPDFFVAVGGTLRPAYAEQHGRVATGFYTLAYVHLSDAAGDVEVLNEAEIARRAIAGEVYGIGPVLLSATVQMGDGVPAGTPTGDVLVSVYEPATPPVGSFAVLVSLDGDAPHRTTAYALVRDNEGGFDADDIAAIAGMVPGQFVRLGGGAQPEVLVSRPMPRIQPAATPREGRRRLLHARIGALHKITGEFEKEIRVRAVESATSDRHFRRDIPAAYRHTVTSSKLLDNGGDWGNDEMDAAITFVEDELYHAGFDFDADQLRYDERQALRSGSAWEVPA